MLKPPTFHIFVIELVIVVIELVIVVIELVIVVIASVAWHDADHHHRHVVVHSSMIT